MDTASPDDERFTANLRAARDEAGLSHEDVAVKMRDLGFEGFRRQTVQRIESGRRGVSIGEAIALASCVGADPLGLARRGREARAEAAGIVLATRRLRDSGRQLAAAVAAHTQDRDRLERAVARAHKAGFADELAQEIGAAKALLKRDAEGT